MSLEPGRDSSRSGSSQAKRAGLEDLSWVEGHRIGRRLGASLAMAVHTDDARRYRDALRLVAWARVLLSGLALEGFDKGYARLRR